MFEISRQDAMTLLALRHGKANALDLELLTALRQQLEELARETAGAVVITGAGRIFSAGVDLVRLLHGGAQYVERFVPELDRALEALFTFPRPLVAAINGHAVAGGCILAAACDHRIMARGAGRIGVPELKVGVPFPAWPLEILRFAAPARLQELVYRGQLYAPAEAREVGLVDELAEPEELVARALAVARELAAVPASSFALTKRLVRAPAIERVRGLAAASGAGIVSAWASAEVLEAVRAYVETTLRK